MGNRKGQTRHIHTINDEGRTCTSCKEFKIWDLYSSNKRLPHGKANMCKSCASSHGKKWRDAASQEFIERDRTNKREYYHRTKGERELVSKLEMVNSEKYYRSHYGMSADQIIRKKEEGCEICGSHVRVQFDNKWADKSIHCVCEQCKATIRRYHEDESILLLLRNFTIQQAIRKGLH